MAGKRGKRESMSCAQFYTLSISVATRLGFQENGRKRRGMRESSARGAGSEPELVKSEILVRSASAASNALLVFKTRKQNTAAGERRKEC